ncbi:hypothetical protein V8C86DRAFT_3113069 [Haematococcus lacustris]
MSMLAAGSSQAPANKAHAQAVPPGNCSALPNKAQRNAAAAAGIQQKGLELQQSGPVASSTSSAVSFQDTPLGLLCDALSLPDPLQLQGVQLQGQQSQHAGQAPAGKQKLAAGQPLLGADSLSPAFAREHNQAVANALRAPAVKDALRQLFYGPLTPADLVGIAHGALTAWDADLSVWCDQQAQQQAALADGSLLSPRRRPQSALQLTGSPAGKASSRLEAGSPGGGANHRRPGSAAAGVNSPGSHLNSSRRQSPGLRVPHSPGNRSRGAVNRGVAAPSFSAVHVLAAVQQANSSNDLDLSVLQLWLVVGMMRLEAKRQTMYNFEMVWDECQSIRADHGLLSSITRAAAWRAFEGLLAYGVAFWIDPGVEGRGRALQYAGVSLRLTPLEVTTGLSVHDQAPEELIRFAAMEC